MGLISVNPEKCTKCGICVEECPARVVLDMEVTGPKVSVPEACIACGHCVAICPYEAIENSRTPLNNQIELKEFPVIDEKTAYLFLRSRRSIRCYKKTSVPREKLRQLIDVARFAPTAGNKQGLSYIVVEDRRIIDKATEITIEWMEEQLKQKTLPRWNSFPYHIRNYHEKGIDTVLRDAPHLILAVSPKNLSTGRENTIFSFAYLELFANTLGLGSCWAGLLEMCAFTGHYPLLNLFNIPEDKKITGAVMVGFPKYSYKRLVDRNPLDLTWLNFDERQENSL